MISVTPKTVARKPDRGICGGRSFNELVDAINSLGQVVGGLVDDRQHGIRMVRVRILDPETGGGKYSAVLRRFPALPISMSTDLSDTDLGADGEPCYVVNAAERNQSTHDLTDGSPISQDFIGAIISHITASAPDQPAKPVVEINGYDFGNCA
jgi:hypothetical protein